FDYRPRLVKREFEQLSEETVQIFKISGINDPEKQRSILQSAKDSAKKTLEPFGWKIPSSDDGLGSRVASGSRATKATRLESDRAPTESTALSFEEKAKTSYQKLQAEALKRKKGYITFEDGENDDHLQNYMADLYNGRIPEILVVHGGNAKVRLANYKAFWKAQNEKTGCEIPQILLGGQGIEEPAVFDSVEGVASIEREKKEEMIEKPMPKEERERIAKETYKTVAAYIEKLDHVGVGVKTAPTDLVEVVKIVGLGDSRKKMLIAWAAPGALIPTKTETGTEVTSGTTFELHAKFNVNRNYPASDEILRSGIPIILTGTGLSNSRVKGLMDKEYVNEIYKDFEGFGGLKQLMDEAKPGSFFHMVKAQQLSMQEKLVASGAEKVLLELRPKKALLKAAIADPRQMTTFPFEIPTKDVEKYIIPFPGSEALDAKKDKYQKWIHEGLLPKMGDLKDSDDPEKVNALKSVLKTELKATEDEEQRVGHLFNRWKDLIKQPNFFQGCTEDPHLELIFNQNLRDVSLRELIPVSLTRLEGRPQIFKIDVNHQSNCYILSGINHEPFYNMFQHLIDWHNEKSPNRELPWKTFRYTTPTTSEPRSQG
ncbi:hypothetical protein CROQUDRAFT_46046, partial [Cronartium quercuum f. sp. fusiforme G11]